MGLVSSVDKAGKRVEAADGSIEETLIKDLPMPPEQIHIMTDYKKPFISIPDDGMVGKSLRVQSFREYPNVSLAQWHRNNGLL
jgi:hypothetical protein